MGTGVLEDEAKFRGCRGTENMASFQNMAGPLISFPYR